jgi:hypothetical protein
MAVDALGIVGSQLSAVFLEAMDVVCTLGDAKAAMDALVRVPDNLEFRVKIVNLHSDHLHSG